MLRIVFVIFCLGFAVPSISQSTIDDLLACTDRYLGSDDFIVNGARYVPPNGQITGSVYYESWGWTAGQVYIKKSVYSIGELRYDLLQDQLITQRNVEGGISLQIVLNASIIDSFSIADRLFVNARHLEGIPSNTQYVESIGVETRLYREQSVFYSAQFGRRNPYGKYLHRPVRLFLPQANDSFIRVNRVNDLASMYSEHKKVIMQAAKERRFNLRRASNAEIVEFLRMIDDL